METIRIGLKQLLMVVVATTTATLWPGLLDAQITVDTDVTAIQLSKAFAGQGIRTRNSITKGSPQAVGYFESESGLPTFDGVIISTGKASALPGPNDNPNVSTFNERGGDKDLTYLANIRTFDAASLEFEFMAAKDSISFRFMYASESYSERLGSTYDDPFLITISGSGLSGDQNFAFIPGTKTPVHSGTVSLNKNKRLYQDNNPYFLNGQPNEKRRSQLNPELMKEIQYDGFTKMFSVGLRVKPKKVYRIKIAIADAGDGNTDSAILLDGKSLTSEEQLWRVRKRERIAFVKDSLMQDSIVKAEIAAARIADSLAAVAAEQQRIADSLALAERESQLNDAGEEMDELDRLADSLDALHANDPNWKNDNDWAERDEGEDEEDLENDGEEDVGIGVHEPLEDNRSPKNNTIEGAVKNNEGIQQQEKAGTGGFGKSEEPTRPAPRPNFAQYRRVPTSYQEEVKFLIMYTGEDYFGSEDDDALVLKIASYLKANPGQKIGLYTPEGSTNSDLRFDILKTDLIRGGVAPGQVFKNGFSFLSKTEETMYHKERIEIWVR